MSKSRAVLLSVPTAVIAIYFAIGFYMAYYFPLQGGNEIYWFVNTYNGPFMGVVLSNYIYDGFANVIVFGIFLGVFIVNNLLLPLRILRGRTLFLLMSMFTIPLIPEVLSRVYLTPTTISNSAGTITVLNIAYGQSGVLAAAMGIIFVFTILTILRGEWVYRLSFAGGLTYGIILGILMGIEVLLFQGLFTVDWAAEIVHIGSLFIGMGLAVVYYFLTEAEKEWREQTAYLIPEVKV